jgi:SPW repeat
MAVRAGVSLPRQWQDWASWAFGIWLCISPWALEFDLESVPTRNAVIVGFLIILVEVLTLSVFRPWEEWVNVALGAWLVISPWVLAILSRAATTDFVVVGVLVIALAMYEMRSVEKES